jgi:hypothetical protein
MFITSSALHGEQMSRGGQHQYQQSEGLSGMRGVGGAAARQINTIPVQFPRPRVDRSGSWYKAAANRRTLMVVNTL